MELALGTQDHIHRFFRGIAVQANRRGYFILSTYILWRIQENVSLRAFSSYVVRFIDRNLKPWTVTDVKAGSY